MAIDDVLRHADALTLSAHKFHGPLGVGAIAVLRRHFHLAPVIGGGGQEGGVRSGTVNVPAIVAAAVALDEAAALPARGSELRDELEAFIEQCVPHCLVVGRRAPRLWTTSYICFPGLLQEDLIEALSARGVHAGTGSACNSALNESRVLRNMGIERLYNQGGVRFSFSRRTPRTALERLVEVFPEAYADAMERSPYL
jgi:cysteine desulfurase